MYPDIAFAYHYIPTNTQIEHKTSHGFVVIDSQGRIEYFSKKRKRQFVTHISYVIEFFSDNYINR